MEDTLTEAFRSDQPCTIITRNGFQMKGVVVGFDGQCVVLENEEESCTVMLDFVSTIEVER